MAEISKCPQCGASVDPGLTSCKYCGEAFPQQPMVQPQYVQQQYAQPQYVQPPQQVPYGYPPQTVFIQQQPTNPINQSWPIKSKIAAGLLGIFLGGIGIHKFYMGKVGMGIVYILFCWTFIPALVGFIEGIVYLSSSDHNFQISNHVRIE